MKKELGKIPNKHDRILGRVLFVYAFLLLLVAGYTMWGIIYSQHIFLLIPWLIIFILIIGVTLTLGIFIYKGKFWAKITMAVISGFQFLGAISSLFSGESELVIVALMMMSLSTIVLILLFLSFRKKSRC